MTDESRSQTGGRQDQGEPESERMRILRMVQEGKLTPEEGAKLLEALGRAGAGEESTQRAGSGAKKSIHIHIEDKTGDVVNVRLPLNLLRLIPRFIPEGLTVGDHKLSQEELTALIDAGEGDIVNIQEPGGDRVVIRIE